MAQSLKDKRPLSPHLQVYKIQITSSLSILHRATGIVLFAGAFLWSLWFVALASGAEVFTQYQAFLMNPFGILILLGWSFSFFYHLCNGIRHLIWDLGVGYEIPTVRFSGWVVVISSLLLTIVAWALGILCKGICYEI